jgi:hypothetical protein
MAINVEQSLTPQYERACLHHAHAASALHKLDASIMPPRPDKNLPDLIASAGNAVLVFEVIIRWAGVRRSWEYTHEQRAISRP